MKITESLREGQKEEGKNSDGFENCRKEEVGRDMSCGLRNNVYRH